MCIIQCIMNILAIFALIGLVSSNGKILGPIEVDYHNHVGIPAARRIKANELVVKEMRISGGSPAVLGQYPFFGGLLITMVNGTHSVCGSSLLTNTRAVTAAHCWRTLYSQAQEFTVIYGSVMLFSGGVRVSTSDVEVHDGYNMTTLVNDIAIIRHDWVEFNSGIHSIPIATGDHSCVGVWAQAVGFGRISDSPVIPHDRFLSHVYVRVMSNEECTKTYGAVITDLTLCVATDGGRSTCSGDSGGPLVFDNRLIGVTSFGHQGACQINNPTGFTRITCFSTWIKEHL